MVTNNDLLYLLSFYLHYVFVVTRFINARRRILQPYADRDNQQMGEAVQSRSAGGRDPGRPPAATNAHHRYYVQGKQGATRDIDDDGSMNNQRSSVESRSHSSTPTSTVSPINLGHTQSRSHSSTPTSTVNSINLSQIHPPLIV